MRAFAILLVFLALSNHPATGQEAIVDQGNQLYQAGDYKAAVAAYEAVVQGGFESHDLYYNLGNAHFKAGDLGRSILNWERALALDPGDEDARANLELAASLTVDDVEPLPRFWLVSAASWATNFLPRSLLIVLVTGAWLALCCGAVVLILGRGDGVRSIARWTAWTGLTVFVLLGANLAVRELGVGRTERGVILAAAVSVRSAPTADDDLTVFEVHEGTAFRIDQRTEQWAEIVLDDGKVGWIPVDALGVI